MLDSAGPLREMWGPLSSGDLAESLLPAEVSLPVPPASDRPAWAPGPGGVDPATLEDQLRRAGADPGQPWPQPSASGFARYFRDGDRDGYEQRVFARQDRLSRAVMAAAATLDRAWLEEVADGATLLCEQSSWCWPAHDDTFQRHGHVVPTVTDPFLDLGAGEVAAQLTWVDHVLGDQLDAYVPGLRARIRHEVQVRVFEPFLNRRDWHWLGLDGNLHNWNPWIHGNLLVAALRLASAPERPVLVAKIIEGLDRYAGSLPADGAVDEGYSYWWNGAGRLLEAIDLLRHATDGALDATGTEALRRTVAFPHSMHLGADWYLNLADGQARPPSDQPWHALHRAALIWGDEQAARHAAAHRLPDAPVANERQGLGRLLLAAHDADWRRATPTSSPLPATSWFPSIQVLMSREQAGTPRGLTLAAKGGHNGENHNHNDVGGVVVAVDGVPVVVDVGRPTYTRQTFGPDRYDIWTMQSSWHNVPEVRGTPQRDGRQYAARSVTADLDDQSPSLRLDLAPAYPRDDIVHWWRTATLDRAAGCVRIADQWELDGDAGEAPTFVNLVLAGRVTLRHGCAEIAPLHGARRAALRWEPAILKAALTQTRLDDPMLTSVWGDSLTRLSIDIGPARRDAITVTLEVV